MKTLLSVVTTLSLTLSLLLTSTVAQALTLDMIGASTPTDGNPGTEWWYTGENPTLGGTAEPNTTVNIVINGVADATTADTSGDWTYTPTTLTMGEHSVSITADGQTIAFSINIGETQPTTTTTTATESAETLPVSGTTEITLLMIFVGGALVVGGWRLSQN